MKFLILVLVLTLVSGCASKPSSKSASAQVDQAEIRRTIHTRASEIRECYEKLLKEHPGAEGKVVMGFDIDDQGLVRNAALKEFPTSLADIADCLDTVFSNLKFNKAPEHTLIEVKYPFCFSSGTGNECFDRFKQEVE